MAVLAIAAVALSRRASARVVALVVDMVRRRQTRRSQVIPTGPGSRWELPGPHPDVAGTGAPPVAPCAPDKRYTALHYQALATQAAHERRLDDLERVVRGGEHPRTPVTPCRTRRDG